MSHVKYPSNSSFTSTKLNRALSYPTTTCSGWVSVEYESDGIPTPGSTACSCSKLLTSAEAQYGTAESISNAYFSRWDYYTTIKTSLPASYNVPADCCVKCGVTAHDVQLHFWPVETSTKGVANASTTNAPTPYSLVSDGFT